MFYFISLSDADAFYGQYTWPGYGAVGPYGAVSSTCYGCRPYGFYYGKREAEPHGTGVAFHPFGVSHVGPTVFGYPYYGKRSAEPHGLGVHPGHATSYVGRTVFGYPRIYGKRSADAEPEADAFYGYYPYHAYGGYSYGVPGGYTSVSGLWG